MTILHEEIIYTEDDFKRRHIPIADDYAFFHNISDGFIGRRIGRYLTVEGEKGYVLQQIDTKVVHVYRVKYLVPGKPPTAPVETKTK